MGMATVDDIHAVPLPDTDQWRTIAHHNGEATQAFAEDKILKGRGYTTRQLCIQSDGTWHAVVYDSGGMAFRHGRGATPLDAARDCGYFINNLVEHV